MGSGDKEAKPISCHGFCVHYWTCNLWVNPVLCTKIQLRRDIKQFVDEKAKQVRTETLQELDDYLMRRYFNHGDGVSRGYSRTAEYKVAKDLLLHIVMLKGGEHVKE